MLRYFFLISFVAGVVILAFAGFRGSKSSRPPIEIFRDMDHQPKIQPQHTSSFFADGRGNRKPVEGTIPLGYQVKGLAYQAPAQSGTDKAVGFTGLPNYYNTGRIGDFYGDGFPEGLTIDEAFLKRGHERYDINCAICHGKAGHGNGVVGQFGVVAIANLTDERIRTMPDGQIYNTITHGKNTMGAYGPQIGVEDRWAIIAYIRALQKSQNSKLADLPEAKQQELQPKK